MAKKPKVPLNVLVMEGTRQAVKDLAVALECSQGDVIDRALLAFDTGALNAGRDPEPDVVPSLSTTPSVDARPKNAFCKHCGERFAGQRFATICPNCKSSGHTLTPAECPACGERGTGGL